MRPSRLVVRLFIPLLLGIGGAVVSGLLRQPGEGPLYRALLDLRPHPTAPRELLLLEVDEEARDRGGPWPWDHQRLGEALLAAAELGAERLLIDLPLSDPAPTRQGPDREELRGSIGKEFSLVTDNVGKLFEAIRSGSIPPAESPRYVSQLLDLVGGSEARLLALAADPPDGDISLSRAERLLGRVWIGYRLRADPGRSAGSGFEKRLVSASALGPLPVGGKSAPIAGGLDLPPPLLIEGARGSGFLEGVSPFDEEGPRLSAPNAYRALVAYEGVYLPSAALLALIERLDSPRVVIGSNGLFLRGALVPRQGRRDLFIPLTPHGEVLVDRPDERYSGPRRLSLGSLLAYRSQEAALALALERLERGGYLSGLDVSPIRARLDLSALETEILESGDHGRLDEYREAESGYLELARRAIDAEGLMEAYADGLLAAGNLSVPERRSVLDLREGFRRDFTAAKKAYETLMSSRVALRDELGASFCVLTMKGGYRSGGALVEDFLGAGLRGAFLRDLGSLPGVLLGVLTALLVALAGLGFGPGAAFAVAGGTSLGLLGGTVAILLTMGTYLAPLPAILGGILAALGCGLIASLGRRDGRSPVSAP